MPTIRTLSGADVFTTRLARELGRAGVETEITWLPPSFELVPFLFRKVPTPRNCDLIHANSWTAGALMDRSLPVVVTVHHLVHDPAYAPHRSFAQAAYHKFHIYPRERRAIHEAHCVTAVSEYVGATIRACMGRQDVAVIPNWIDCDAFSPVPHMPATASGGAMRLLCVGNTSRRKGSDLLLPLLKLLGPGYELRCTGGLRGQIAQGPLSNYTATGGITWLGKVSDEQLIAEYRNCDIVVSLSRYEGFGYSALEGMACGKPVVAFASGGLVDVVRHGETGYLVETNDIAGMAARIRELAASPVLRNRLGSRGRIESLSYQESWRSYIDIYRNAATATAIRRLP